MNEDLTQTQTFTASQFAPPAEPVDVFANLVAVSKVDCGNFPIHRDNKEVFIGRNESCFVKVQKDKKVVSGQHCRIYRDDGFRYFIEELSANGAFLNENLMKKGETRALKHGDVISICVHHASKSQAPFAAWIFRLADHSSDNGASDDDSNKMQTATPAVNSVSNRPTTTPGRPGGPHRNLVNEQWVTKNWDMRLMLGAGNFSEVRLGVQVKKPGSEKVAVKVVDKKRFTQFQNKRESQLSLQDEAELLMKMNNPGIVHFYEWFETDDKLYIAMELLTGGDLLQFILEHGCFTENVARRIFRSIAGAVKYLHEKNIVHRDLKPENILLTSKNLDDMMPKLADFGLARMNMKTKDCKTFCGTPHYFAPEVINTFRDRDTGHAAGYGKQVDMWSLGVILYIMLSGTPPFEEDGLYEQILEGRYEFDVQEWTQVSPEAKELVRQLMTVNPKGRLTIQQTLAHKWFTLDQTSPPENDKIASEGGSGIRHMDFDEAGTTAKRRRTIGDCDDAKMFEATTFD